MNTLFSRYLYVLQLISKLWIGRIGVILSTTAFFSFFILETLSFMKVFHNTYVGIITYTALPAIWLFGIFLADLSLRQQNLPFWATIRTIWTGTEEAELRASFTQSVIPILLVLTAANVFFIVMVSSRTLHFMDQSEFCGTACHTVMGPEWAVYEGSPHARVACVDCHIGEGLQALASSKLNGAWQLISTTLDLYHRPIETPIHNLRPARETCEKCHWPEKFYGSKLVQKKRFMEDSLNTKQFTTLNLKVDAQYGIGHGIHWHIAEENEVRYTSIDDKRESILWVEVRRPDGNYHRYENTSITEEHSTAEDLEIRTMDCVDCHNRATHIYETPDDAVDLRIARDEIDTSLPFIKREAMHALSREYASKEDGLHGIYEYLSDFYSDRFANGEIDQAGFERSVASIQSIYERNIFPHMGITWNTYPNHIGHQIGEGCFACHNFQDTEQTEGCFRCHTQAMQDEDGNHISDDCTLCHSILSLGEDDPLKYLTEDEFNTFEEHKNKYLREEYLEGF